MHRWLWLCFISTMALAGEGDPSLFQGYLEKETFITAQREISDRLMVDPKNPVWHEWQKRLEQRFSRLNLSEPGTLSAAYVRLVRAWRTGDALESRNAAYRYLALSEHDEPVSEAQRTEVRLLFDEFEKRRRERDRNNQITLSTATAVPVALTGQNFLPGLSPKRESRRARRTTDARRNQKTSKDQKRDVTALVRRADRLRENGRLDEARRLYRLAQETDPSSEAARAGMEHLEVEWK